MPTPASAATTPAPLIDISRIYAEPAALELPRSREMAARWPDAEIVPVESHWRIPELHGDEADVRVRYRMGEKRRHLDRLLAILVEELPYCRVRYAF